MSQEMELGVYTAHEMERSLISYAWSSSREAMVLKQLEERDFQDHSSRVGFLAIRKIMSRGDEVSIIVVRQELVDKGFLEAFNVLSNHMLQSGSDILMASQVRALVGKVEHASCLRRAKQSLKDALRELEGQAADTPQKIQENVTRNVALAFSRIRREGGIFEKEGLVELAAYLSEQEHRRMNGGKSSRDAIPTGFSDLDEVIFGGEPEDLILLTGPTSTGKSALAQQFSREWARHGIVYYWSGEMSRHRLLTRAVMQAAQVSEVKAGKVHQVIETSSRRVFYDSDPATMDALAARVELFAMQYPLVALVVDYVGLTCKTEYASVSEASKALVRLKKSLKVPVLALVQMSRKIYDRIDKAPVLSDLKESGQLENDADKVLMLHKPSMWDKNADKRDVTVWVRKNREGERDVPVRMAWNGGTRSFGRWVGQSNRPRNPALRDDVQMQDDVDVGDLY